MGEHKKSNQDEDDECVIAEESNQQLLGNIKRSLHEVTLERKSNFKRSLVCVFLFLILEIVKQMSIYSLSISNGGKFPIPSSMLIGTGELLKLFCIYVWAKFSKDQTSVWDPSFKFSLPAICYFLTNLMYLRALTVISPPIWMLLIQTRTLYTAVAYKIIFGQEVTMMQGVGCILVVCSIVIARFSTLDDGHTTVSFVILCVSQVSSIISTAASICVELLLKNDGRSFFEQQWWLYLFGSFFSIMFTLLKEDVDELLLQIQDVTQSSKVLLLLVFCILSTSLAGMCVPVIVRNMDTIVKDYLSASNNLILSIVTAVVFPSQFSISWQYLLSLAMLLFGILLYEKKF